MATPPPSTFDEDFSPVRSPHTLYFAAVQRTILQAICRTDKDLLTSSRLAIKLWVAPSGAVARVKLLDRIGERGREEALSAAFEQSNIGLPPPADFQQPVTLVIQPKQSQDSRDCDGPGAEARHASNQ